jgi:Cys-tRNA(Pro)/Cys-tRNA(Cys) deacylase
MTAGLQTLEWVHRPSGRSCRLVLQTGSAMPPSDSTRLLLEHMVIRPGESVLDLGAGSGAIGLAALLLGAGAVWWSEIDPDCEALIHANLQRLQAETGIHAPAQVTIGNLFTPINDQRFDHILVNPPSVPSPDDSLAPAYRSGPDGRLFHDAIQALAGYSLNDGGRLSFVQGSLSNRPLSIARLQAQGYVCRESESICRPIRSHYPLAWLQTLAARGEAELILQGDQWHESRWVVEATLPQAARTGVMQRLETAGVSVRRLPHLREARTVAMAAEERGVPEHEMIKCILLKDRRERFVLACLAGNAELDPQRVREVWPEFSRLSFSSPQEITQMTGHVLGSVAPISLRESVPVVLDADLATRSRVNISAGDPRLGLELALVDLLRVLGPEARFGPIRKAPATPA